MVGAVGLVYVLTNKSSSGDDGGGGSESKDDKENTKSEKDLQENKPKKKGKTDR